MSDPDRRTPVRLLGLVATRFSPGPAVAFAAVTMQLDQTEGHHLPPAHEFDPFFDLWFDLPPADDNAVIDAPPQGIEDLVEMLYR
jgi:hypothetical protein